MTWLSPPIKGLACDLDSVGYHALARATEEVLGKVCSTSRSGTPAFGPPTLVHASPRAAGWARQCEHIADTGTLPLVGDLRAQGMDLQTVGYGVEDAYHADNEFARLSDYGDGFKVLTRLLRHLDALPAAAAE